MSATYSRRVPGSFMRCGSCERTDYLANHFAMLPKPQWFPDWPTARQPGQACAPPLTGRGWMLCWGAADVSGTWTTTTTPLLMIYFTLLTINCFVKFYTILLTFFSPWFRIADRHLLTHALMTNFCLTKLLISTNVTLSFACFTETAIDVYIFAN